MDDASSSSSPPPPDRVKAYFIARLAKKTGRIDDMLDAMRNLAVKLWGLTEPERYLLSDACMRKTLFHQASRRTLLEMLENETFATDTDLITQYLRLVEKDISDICNLVIKLVDQRLLPSCEPWDHMSTLFYLKMRGDYFRCLSEIRTGERLNVVVAESLKAYESAYNIARAQLSPIHPERLRAALGFSSFCYDILKAHDRACEIAENALEEAAHGIGSEEVNQIMGLMRYYLKKWKDKRAGHGGNTDGGNNVPPAAA